MKKELSKKNPYWISKHRQLELEHFCRQYDEFKEILKYLISPKHVDAIIAERKKRYPNEASIVHELTMRRIKYQNYISSIEDSIEETTSDMMLRSLLFDSVITGKTYNYYSTKEWIPIPRQRFYKARRKFFYILSEKRS